MLSPGEGSMDYDSKKERLSLLLDAVAGKKRVRILTHDNPDPDALASAFAFHYLLKKTTGKKAVINVSGPVGRAENRAMIKELGIPVHPIKESTIRKTDEVVLVDSQPGAGNNSLPDGIIPKVVIDHHPPRRGMKAEYLDIRPDYGTTITIIWEYLKSAEIDLSTNVATAIAYAISSETQDLGREAGPADRKAYLDVFPQISFKKFSQLYNPKLSWEYFQILHKAISNAHGKQNAIYCNLGDIPNPDFVHQIADLFLRIERKSWSMAMGRADGVLYLSLRTSKENAYAGKKLRKIIGKRGTAGGHDMIAGGRIAVGDLPIAEVLEIEDEITRSFLKVVGLSPEGAEDPMRLRPGSTTTEIG